MVMWLSRFSGFFLLLLLPCWDVTGGLEILGMFEEISLFGQVKLP